ncbi:MAG: general secretion pathway protein GspK [Planctomycetes bacterium]|nr:general secretion pathway protein GspK [Planctomycetota bacterium]
MTECRTWAFDGGGAPRANRMKGRTHRGRRTEPLGAAERRGVVLLIVLFVVIVLSLSAYTFTELMLTQYDGALSSRRAAQARCLVDSGMETVRYLLLQDDEGLAQAGGVYDNQPTLRAVAVVPDTDPQFLGCFSVLAPVIDPQGNISGVRYGLEDESARLNLNFLPVADNLLENGGRTLLMALPGMTEDTADAIMDWLDEDEEPREYGAESEYYTRLQPAYYPKNGPLDSVEELLLVRGVTPQMLFGADSNRNGIIDPHESSSAMTAASTSVTGQNAPTAAETTDLLRGWSPFLTLYSAERNVNASGLRRVNVNQDDMETLFNELSEVVPVEWATFIVAYRQVGPYSGDQPGEMTTGELDFAREGKTRINQILDLVNAKVEIQFVGQSAPVVVTSPFPGDLIAMNLYLPDLLDNCTVNPNPMIPGRININQAPRAILLGIPGMTEELVDEIVKQRDITGEGAARDNPNRRFETWLLTEGLLFDANGMPDIATMKQLAPFCCGGGDVHRAQVVGYFQGGGVSSRAEVVFDDTEAVPRVVFWRDLSHLGRGYNLETLGVRLTGQLGL